MQLGMVGLGRMGANIVRRLKRSGHDCVAFDTDPAAVQQLAGEGVPGASDLAAFVKQLTPPRAVWVMVPAGATTGNAITALGNLLAPGDVMIDGGNTFYQDDVSRAATLKAKGIHHLDVGTSGGVWGLERGYCLMIGGERDIADRLMPIFVALAPGGSSAGRGE
jgi:6-phosphogluconate dehydrogenase